ISAPVCNVYRSQYCLHPANVFFLYFLKEYMYAILMVWKQDTIAALEIGFFFLIKALPYTNLRIPVKPGKSADNSTKEYYNQSHVEDCPTPYSKPALPCIHLTAHLDNVISPLIQDFLKGIYCLFFIRKIPQGIICRCLS